MLFFDCFMRSASTVLCVLFRLLCVPASTVSNALLQFIKRFFKLMYVPWWYFCLSIYPYNAAVCVDVLNRFNIKMDLREVWWEDMDHPSWDRNKWWAVVNTIMKCLLYSNICTNKWCKFILKLLRYVLVLIYHLQEVYKLCYLKLWIIKMIKYNIVVCCYDKILVNIASYVIPG